MNEEKNDGNTGCLIVFVIIAALIFIPIIIGIVSSTVETSRIEKHEQQLIQDGKTKDAEKVMDEIVEILKDKDESQLKKYLAKDFTYYDNDNYEHKYLSSFFSDLNILSSSYEIEKRGNDIKDEETYRIYWNVVEANKARGVDKSEITYCLQKITVMLKRAIKQDMITYEIERIILTDN